MWTYERQIIPLEKWAWGVIYKDGTECKQFADDGTFHRIGEVDQSNVRYFILYETNGDGRLQIVVPDGAKIIHKYRNITLSVGEPNEQRLRIYMFGYKHGKHTHINYVMPDNAIIQATDDINLAQFF